MRFFNVEINRVVNFTVMWDLTLKITVDLTHSYLQMIDKNSSLDVAIQIQPVLFDHFCSLDWIFNFIHISMFLFSGTYLIK